MIQFVRRHFNATECICLKNLLDVVRSFLDFKLRVEVVDPLLDTKFISIDATKHITLLHMLHT